MAKLGRFLVVFLPAYVLSKILLGVFGLNAFSFAEPNFWILVLEIVFWLLSFGVSVIVYLTLRDGIRGLLKKKKKEEESHEIS